MKIVRIIKMTKTTTTGTVIVDTVASTETIGEARHSALKRLFATKLSIQMEELYVFDTSGSSVPFISLTYNRFSTFTSHQPRSLVSVRHAAISIIKNIKLRDVRQLDGQLEGVFFTKHYTYFNWDNKLHFPVNHSY